MVFYESKSTDPYFNLALEEYFFTGMDRGKSYFILWQNRNTIVVGKHQNTAEEVNQEYVDEHGIKVARRLSGGGAVYHDEGNLNFTFIVDSTAAPDFDFKVFTLPVVQALGELGVRAEISGRNDITIGGKKICGNSQYIRGGRLLHHGCIMLDTNLEVVTKALRVNPEKIRSKSIKSVRSRVTSINENAAAPITMERFKTVLRNYIFRAEELEQVQLTAGQLKEIERLRDTKYALWEWNYGASPKYDLHNEKKFPAGLVSVYLNAAGGKIESIKFYGDFFSSGELSELEEKLAGLRLDDTLEMELLKLNIDRYFHGITASDIFGLIMYD